MPRSCSKLSHCHCAVLPQALRSDRTWPESGRSECNWYFLHTRDDLDKAVSCEPRVYLRLSTRAHPIQYLGPSMSPSPCPLPYPPVTAEFLALGSRTRR